MRIVPPETSETLNPFPLTTAYAPGPTSAAPRGEKPSAGEFVITMPPDVTIRRELAVWSATTAASMDASQSNMFVTPNAAVAPTPSIFPVTLFPARRETLPAVSESARMRYPVFSFV